MDGNFVVQGDICYSLAPTRLRTVPDGFLVCIEGRSAGVFDTLPRRFSGLPKIDCSGRLIVPGLCDLHMHAPQYAFRGLGMDLELLDWLESRTFPEEAKYADLQYARTAYAALVRDLVRGPNTRVCLYSTIHLPATVLLMDMLEASGLVAMVGKVNMDRNCPDRLREPDAAAAAADIRRWLETVEGRYANVSPILTPRFIPTCSDDLMRQIAGIQRETGLPVQSHLSENKSEIEWVAGLCPDSAGYGDAYRRFGLFGGGVPTIMAHCTWSDEAETELLRERGVFVAHCPQSNMNLSSGIAPARRFLDRGVRLGLGSDVAGGCHSSIFRAMSDAVQASKLRWRLCDQADAPLTMEEAFWLGTGGGGAFFGKTGSFDEGFEFDALVIDDATLAAPFELTIAERLARTVYFSGDKDIRHKFVRGRQIF